MNFIYVLTYVLPCTTSYRVVISLLNVLKIRFRNGSRRFFRFLLFKTQGTDHGYCHTEFFVGWHHRVYMSAVTLHEYALHEIPVTRLFWIKGIFQLLYFVLLTFFFLFFLCFSLIAFFNRYKILDFTEKKRLIIKRGKT